ncbi:hypothetical protein D7Y04_38285 [Corallococcus sp. AB038B]|nr:hypothetical protein D7Y04_38285 [Corallococcus sp. AB038B]
MRGAGRPLRAVAVPAAPGAGRGGRTAPGHVGGAGLEKALAFQLPLPSAVFLGLVTSVGGGVIRDVLLGERTALVSPGELYATVALLCGLLYVALAVGLKLPAPLAEAAAIAGASLLRLTAMWRQWRLPHRFDLLQLLDRIHARRPRGPP